MIELPTAILSIPTMTICGINKISFDVVDTRDTREKTVKYTIYRHDDGFRVRRRIKIWWCNEERYYQMNRNSHTNEWPAFETVNEAIMYLDNYFNNL